MKTNELPQSAWTDSQAAGSQSPHKRPFDTDYLTCNKQQQDGRASNDASYEHDVLNLLASHYLLSDNLVSNTDIVNNDKAITMDTDNAEEKPTIDSGYKKAIKKSKPSPAIASTANKYQQQAQSYLQPAHDDAYQTNAAKEQQFNPYSSNIAIDTLESTKIPERVFMNGLIKHTAIALAIIVPLAAFSAYAAPSPAVPIDMNNNVTATSNGMTDKATTEIAAVEPASIIYKPASVPTTVDSVDLEQYAGTWYEIGRLPMYFQRNCARDVTATYTGKTDGSGISVLNQCIAEDGTGIAAEGLAKPADNSGSKLKVSFLPSWIRWLPVGRADYWVLARDADYKTALVGTPDHKYLWILARSPDISQQTYAKYRQIAQQQGYDLKEFALTTQSKKTVSLVP